MTENNPRWLDEIRLANSEFKSRIETGKLPQARMPGQAVITCMDPRVNLEAIGIPSFSQKGEGTSATRVIRTIGAMADHRSLIIGIYLAGIREIIILMHTDCGCSLAHSKIDVIIENMKKQLPPDSFTTFKSEIGEPFEERLQMYLKTFDDPHEAIKQEIESIHHLPMIPEDLIIHGLLYELHSGQVEIVVNGYR